MPSVGRMIPARTWRNVLLPAPFGPMTASDSPWLTWTLTWRSAQKRSGFRRWNSSANDPRTVDFRVNRRLYRTPRSLTAMA